MAKALTPEQIEARVKLAEAIKERNSAIAWKKYSLSDRGIRAAVRIAKADPRMRIDLDLLDTQGFELNTPSGIVDLTNGKLGPHNPKSYHTKLTGAGYDTGADCLKWNAFLHDIFQGEHEAELIAYMQRLLGYAATGKVREHILPFFHGEGDNGKTCLLETVSLVLGDYAIAAPSKFLMAGKNEHATEIARLQGARFVVCSEINQEDRFDEAKVKWLTGGEKLTGRFMRSDYTDFTPTHTLFLVGNHQPTVRDGGRGFWRRLQLIPFQNQVQNKIDAYHQQLFDAEGPAILAWIVQGAIAVSKNGLQPPEFVKTATKDYEQQEDTIRSFVDEATQRVSLTFKVLSGKVYAKYAAWCHDNGLMPKPANVFSREIVKCVRQEDKHRPKVERSNGKRFICGLKLNDDKPALDAATLRAGKDD